MPGTETGWISPEGAYPVIGRSINYRFGSFHALSDAALLHLLPKNVSPAQVRCALTAVISRQLAMPHTFNPEGWLRSGYAGNRPLLGLTLQGLDGKESMERDRRRRRPSSVKRLLKAVGEEGGLDRSYLPISLLVHVEPVFHIV